MAYRGGGRGSSYRQPAPGTVGSSGTLWQQQQQQEQQFMYQQHQMMRMNRAVTPNQFSAGAPSFQPAAGFAAFEQQQQSQDDIYYQQQQAALAAQAAAGYYQPSGGDWQNGGYGSGSQDYSDPSMMGYIPMMVNQYYDPSGYDHTIAAQQAELMLSSEDELIIDVKLCLDELTHSPGFLEPVSDLIQSALLQMPSETLLHNVIDLIIEQGSSQRNFAYAGAQLCQYLIHHCPITGTLHFKDVFLKKMQEKFESVLVDIPAGKYLDAVSSWTIFFGECYLAITLKQGSEEEERRVDQLQNNIVTLLPHLIKSMDTVRSAIQLLKMLGRILEPIGVKTPEMDSLFEELQQRIDSNSYDLSTITALRHVISLRETSWGQDSENASNGEQSAGVQSVIDGYTYYNATHLPESQLSSGGETDSGASTQQDPAPTAASS